MKKWLTTPWNDLLRGSDACLTRGVSGLVRVAGGLVLGWWLYVPVHELLHAWGCLLSGGEVTELEIQAKYGGAILAKLIPYVVAGGSYAGRLSGFSTGGSDLVYLATVAAPFLLTLFPGVWLLRRSARGRAGFWFGFSLPLALAPFLSVIGDSYEFGSILVTQVRPWSESGMLAGLRGDDLFVKAKEVAAEGEGLVSWIGYSLSVGLGILFSFAVYGVSGAIARALGSSAVEASTGKKS